MKDKQDEKEAPKVLAFELTKKRRNYEMTHRKPLERFFPCCEMPFHELHAWKARSLKFVNTLTSETRY